MILRNLSWNKMMEGKLLIHLKLDTTLLIHLKLDTILLIHLKLDTIQCY